MFIPTVFGTLAPSIFFLWFFNTSTSFRKLNLKVIFVFQFLLFSQKKERNKTGHKSERRGEQGKWKVTFETADTFTPTNYHYILFSRSALTQFLEADICIWKGRPRSVWPVNGFLALFSQTVTRERARLASKHIFWQKFPGTNGLKCFNGP